MLPLSLLKTAVGHPVLVELKNGETYNGNLVSCDSFMNMTLSQVICTSRDGDKFWKIAQCYVRGNTVKYMCVPDEIIDMVPEEPVNPAPSTAATSGVEQAQQRTGQRGGRGGNNRESNWGSRKQQQPHGENENPRSGNRGGRGGNQRGRRGSGNRT